MHNIIFKTALIKGEAGNNIQSIEKTATSGAVDTYTITLTDGSTTTFNVTNGSNIASITLTGSSGLVDTYTVTLTDGSTTTFDVRNGQDYTVPTNGMIYYDDDNALPEGYEVAGNFTDEILAGEASGDIASFIGLNNTIVKELVATIEPVQAGSGTPSPTNVRAISGHTSCTVTDYGINQWDEEWELGRIDLDTGEKVTATSQIRAKNYIKIRPNDYYYTKCLDGIWFAFYDANYNIVTTDLPTGEASESYGRLLRNTVWKAPTTAKYMLFYLVTAYGTTYNHDISINNPSTDTAYHAYTADTATITFDNEGTIYGGTINFTTGKLTVDKVTVNVESLSLRSGGSLTNGTKSTCCQFNLPSSQYATITAYNVRKGAIGNKGTETDPYYAYQLSAGVNTFENCEFALMTNGQYITVYLPDTTITTTEDFITALGNYQICYPLATPLEITSLTADDLHTLEGINNVTASTGAIEKIVYFKSSIIADIYERLLALE